MNTIATTFKLKVAKGVPAGTRFGLALDALFAKKGEYVVLVGVNFRTSKRNIDEPLFAKF